MANFLRSDSDFDDGLPGLSGPSAVRVSEPPEGSVDYEDMPILQDMAGTVGSYRADSDSDRMSEPEGNLNGSSDEGNEDEEDEGDENQEDEEDSSVTWKEIKEPGDVTGFEIEGFDSRSVGPNHNLDPLTATSLDFFNLFFDDDFFQRLVDETNRYASQCIAVAATVATVAAASSSVDDAPVGVANSSWTETTLPEMKAYIAMNIAMGLREYPEGHRIWSTRPLFYDPYLARIMSRDRFCALSRYFHIVDNTGAVTDYRLPGYDPMHKVRPIIDLFNTRSAALYRPKQYLSVDEAMIEFKGRHHAKQYVKNKPTKWGFKLWKCAESGTGYALQVEVYEGKARTPARIEQRSQFGLGFDVVNELTRKWQGKNHVVVFDRFFSSVTLLEHLLQKKTYAISTVMMNRKGLPPSAKKLQLKKSAPLRQYRKGNVLLTVFYDKRQISHLSTACLPSPIGSVEKPIVNVDYNKYMGGVDVSDQHASYYRVGRKTMKWWKYIVWHLINLAITNAYVVYRTTPPNAVRAEPRKKRISHLDFRADIIEQLVANFSRAGTAKRQRASVDTAQMDPAVAITHLLEKTHLSRICRYCSKKSGSTARTTMWCKDCAVYLCPVGCFQRYHAELCDLSIP